MGRRLPAPPDPVHSVVAVARVMVTWRHANATSAGARSMVAHAAARRAAIGTAI